MAGELARTEVRADVNATLAQSYRQCQAVARRAASNFYWAIWLLPAEQRQAMWALYAFARHVDDLGDGDAPSAVRARQLREWRGAFEQALAGESTHPLLPAVVDALQRFSIPPSHLRDVMTGVERDLEPVGWETWDELRDYCQHVASAVGLACLHIWSPAPLPAYPAARDCGVAFQLTNILRDLREDARRGRLYLPREDLRTCGVDEAELRQLAADGGEWTADRSAALVNLLRFQVTRAAEYFDRGRETRQFLTGGARRAFDLMFRTYGELLDQIRRRPLLVLRRRLRVATSRKLWIAAASCLGQPPSSPGAAGGRPRDGAATPTPAPP